MAHRNGFKFFSTAMKVFQFLVASISSRPESWHRPAWCTVSRSHASFMPPLIPDMFLSNLTSLLCLANCSLFLKMWFRGLLFPGVIPACLCRVGPGPSAQPQLPHEASAVSCIIMVICELQNQQTLGVLSFQQKRLRKVWWLNE